MTRISRLDIRKELRRRGQSCRAAVYCITNTRTGQLYIGKSVDPVARWKMGYQGRFEADRKLYPNAFTYTIVDWYENEDKAYEAEHILICHLLERGYTLGRTLYNLRDGGKGGRSQGKKKKPSKQCKVCSCWDYCFFHKSNGQRGKRIDGKTKVLGRPWHN